MRCLYCGEPLSLLRKLTGKAEFCSEAHREAYQDEFNSLALQRLASQPSQGRRTTAASSIPTPEPEVQRAPEPAAESFGGLAFPDDPEDFEPTFDSPIFTRGHIPDPEPESPVFESPVFKSPVTVVTAAVNEPPPPLCGLLAGVHPRAAGQEPPSYSFPLCLDDYPRACLLATAATGPVPTGEIPFGGYVDLPEPFDDEMATGCTTSEPLLDGMAFGIEVPSPWTPPSSEQSRELAFETGLFSLAVELEHGFGESAFAASTCTLAVPAYQRQTDVALMAHGSSLVFRHRTPLAGGVSVGDSAVYLPEPDAITLVAELAPWTPAVPPVLSLELPSGPDRTPGALGRWGDDFDWTYGLGEDAAGAPVCEAFETERPLVAPPFQTTLNPMVSEASLVWFELVGDATEAAALGAGPIPFAGERSWNCSRPVAVTGSELPEAGLAAFEGNASLPLDEAAWSAVPAPWSADHAPAVAAPAPLPVVERCLAYACGAGVGMSGFAAPEALVKSPDAEWALFALASPAPFAVPRVDPMTHSLRSADEFEALAVDLEARAPKDDPLSEPAVSSEPEPAAKFAAWPPAPPVLTPHASATAASPLPRVRVKDFAWPDFAAGCDSLFTPDQPFRFHELPFVQRGTTDKTMGEAMHCELMEGLLLPYADDRFEAILHPPIEPVIIEDWLDETSSKLGSWPQPQPQPRAISAFAAPAPEPPPAAAPPPPKTAEPPASWQQAARAMYEGEQQVPREPHERPAKSVIAVPVVSEPVVSEPVVSEPVITEPLNGLELARTAPSQPPIPFAKGEPVGQPSQDRAPASDQQQFEWRREQPQQGAPSPPPPGASTVSVNTTIVVDGNPDGVVVESAVRVSLGGNKKKKTGGVEKFTEGEDLEASRVEMAAPEGLPEFSAEPPELRAVLQHIPPSAESIQWPKFSVTPMRRRIAFGPPARGSLFSGTNGQSSTKSPPSEAKILPPKKSVGSLFKKLTNS
jgi:hypothetical protein